MKFHEKLSFLMTLTQTSNKALSAKLNVDPSLISMLKTGKRKIPKNTEYINILADFFGKNCTSEYQRYSLSDAIGNENIKLISAPNQIADIIFNWLNDSSVVYLNLKMAHLINAPMSRAFLLRYRVLTFFTQQTAGAAHFLHYMN